MQKLPYLSSTNLFNDFSKHISFSKVDTITLLQVGIKTGPLFLVQEKRTLAEELGSTEVSGKALTMDVLRQLIELVRRHVSVVVSSLMQSLSLYFVTAFTDRGGMPRVDQCHSSTCCINHVDEPYGREYHPRVSR
jgi:hypothetical protein